MNLGADEFELVGNWLFDGHATRNDEVALRIAHLTDHVLQKVAISKAYGTWETLFKDPNDGRLWERTYPEGHLQGGGPPKLAVISEVAARDKYDFT